MATKPEFLVTKDEMLVALGTVSITISSPEMAFEILCLCQACSLLKGKGQIGPFFIFLGAISDCNAGFLQWCTLAETLHTPVQCMTKEINVINNSSLKIIPLVFSRY